MTTRDEAVDRVRLRLDDVDEVLVTDAQVQDALRLAQEEVWQMVIEAGGNLAATTAAVSATNGVFDLASLSPRPIRLISVSEKNGANGRLTIMPARAVDGMTNYPQSNVDIYLTYIPHVAFPSSGSTSFVWGDTDAPNQVLDELMVLKAVQTIKITENEINNALERRVADLTKMAQSQINIPSAYAMPMLGRSTRTKSRLRYMLTSPYTIQLVW